MKSEQLFERLKAKKPYEKFMKDNKEAFLYAIFTMLSRNEKEGDKIQFDFYVPKLEKIAYSEYPFDEVTVQAQKSQVKASVLNLKNVKVDIEDLWEVLEKVKVEKRDDSNVTKLMGVLREGFWDITCTTHTLDVLRIKVNSITGDLIDYKKENLTNFIQIKKVDKK